MNLSGRVENGVIVLEGTAILPEGAQVVVSYPEGRSARAADPRPVVLPIFKFDGPPDIDLTNERLAEILDRDDASA